MTTLRVVAFLTFLLAPAPQGVAVNYLTKECAGYWGGDEYVYYVPPAGWTYYLPDENNQIRTPDGTYAWTGSAEDFCNDIRYRYVSDNIAKDRGERVVVTPEFLLEAEATRRLHAELALGAGLLVIGAALGTGLCLVFRRR